MQSRLLESTYIEEPISRWNWNRGDADSVTQEAVYQICLEHKSYRDEDVIEKHSIVRVSLIGNTRKFTRTVSFTVGEGLFDMELEMLLVGKKRGESGSVEHSTGTVSYEILDIKTLIVPALDDWIAQSHGYGSAEKLYRGKLDEALRSELNGQVYDFSQDYLGSCVFSMDDEELDAMVEKEMERCRGIAKSMGMVFDEMSKEELMGAVGQPDIPSFRKMVRDIFTYTLQCALIECRIEGRDPATVATDDAYTLRARYANIVSVMALKYV